MFKKAYVDDSLGERAWVDNALCDEFVENVKTAFSTKPIPFSVDNPANTPSASSNGSFESSDKANGKKATASLNRYVHSRPEIESFLIETLRVHLSNTATAIAANKSNLMLPQQQQRQLGQNPSISAADHRGLLKLLQSTCGVSEVRTMVLSKLETWLANPKLIALAQDLLLAVCVNCAHQSVLERETISQLIRLKPKIKQQQHYYDCIRELVKASPAHLEFLIQTSTLNELLLQQQQLSQSQQPQQQIARNQHNLYLLQTAFSADGPLSSKIFARTMHRLLLQKSGDDYLRLLRISLRDVIRNSRSDFDLLKFTSELVTQAWVCKEKYNC